jgi:polyisoprenoid-binding protein YceI
MKNLFIALILGAAALATPGLSRAQGVQTYAVDPAHSFFFFKIGHFGIGNVYGRFDKVGGTVAYDAANPANDVFQVEVQTGSVDTNSAQRDTHLKSPDFFNAQQFPTATFKSTAVKAVDAKNFEVSGDFTLNGVTKPLTVPVTFIGAGKDPQGASRVGAEAKFTIKRSDFGIKAFLPAVSDEVELTIAIEGVQK